jgi:hypothetical protein
LDVVDRAQPGEQGLAIVLEHIAELDLVERLAVEQDLPGVDRNKPGDHVDQRALAAAVRPEHRDQLAARNVEIEVVVDDGVAEPLGQAADGDMRPGGGRSIRRAARNGLQSIFRKSGHRFSVRKCDQLKSGAAPIHRDKAQ